MFEINGAMYLTGGWLRLAACKQLGKHWARVRVIGSSNEIEDAILAALKSHTRGLRRSRADNRRCVRLALEAELYADLGSNPAMAKDLGVPQALVDQVRTEWESEQGGSAADLEANVSTDNGVQPERKPKKAKPSPSEAFRKNVERIGRDVPQFFEAGTEVHEATERLVLLVREHESDGQTAASRKAGGR